MGTGDNDSESCGRWEEAGPPRPRCLQVPPGAPRCPSAPRPAARSGRHCCAAGGQWPRRSPWQGSGPPRCHPSSHGTAGAYTSAFPARNTCAWPPQPGPRSVQPLPQGGSQQSCQVPRGWDKGFPDKNALSLAWPRGPGSRQGDIGAPDTGQHGIATLSKTSGTQTLGELPVVGSQLTADARLSARS